MHHQKLFFNLIAIFTLITLVVASVATMTPVRARPARAAASVSVAGQGAVWDQSIFATENSGNIANGVQASDFVLTVPHSLDGFSVWLSDDTPNDNGLLDGFSGTLSWAIYDDNSGEPGSLLDSGQDTSPMLTDTEVQTDADHDIIRADAAFPINFSLPAGTYWLVLHEGTWLSPYDGTDLEWQGVYPVVGYGSTHGSPETNPTSWTDSALGPDLAFALWGASVWDQGSLRVDSNEDTSESISEAVVANDFMLRVPQTLSGFSVWLADDISNDNDTLDTFSGTLSWVIYDDGDGEPGSILFSGEDSPLLVNGDQQNNSEAEVFRADLSFASPITLPSGIYWLALHEGSWGSPSDGSVVWWQWAAASGEGMQQIGTPVTDPQSWTSISSGFDGAFMLWGAPMWDQSTFSLDNSQNISSHAVANDFTLTSPTGLIGFSAWLADGDLNDNGWLDSFSETLGWAIYSDNSGQPGTLLYTGEDNELIMEDTGTQDNFDKDLVRVEASFPGTLNLAAGTYWLVLHEGAWGSSNDGSFVWWQWSSPNLGAFSYSGLPETAPSVWSAHMMIPMESAFILWGDVLPPATATPTPTETSTVTASPTGTMTATSTLTITHTATPTETSTVTETTTRTPTSTPTGTATVTPTWTVTSTPTITATSTQTATPTVTIAPLTVTINQAAGQSDPDYIGSATKSIHFTAVFSEAVSGFTSSDVSFSGTTLTGTLSATVTEIAPMDGTTYNVAVRGMIPKGTVFVSIPANAVISIPRKGATNQASTSTDNNITVDYVLVEIGSTASKDGWLLETSETSSTGGSLNSSATTLSVGDDTSDRQYRAMVDFATGSLPDNAILFAINLHVIQSSITGTNPLTTHGALKTEIKTNYFGTAGALQTADFESAPDKSACNFETVPEMIAGLGPAYRCIVFDAAFPYINLTGTTQFRLRFALDDNDDLSADLFNFYSGDFVAPSQRPRLFVKYYIPPAP